MNWSARSLLPLLSNGTLNLAGSDDLVDVLDGDDDSARQGCLPVIRPSKVYSSSSSANSTSSNANGGNIPLYGCSQIIDPKIARGPSLTSCGRACLPETEIVRRCRITEVAT